MSKQATKKFATVEIGLDECIPYVALDPTPGGSNLGRAEFQFCPTWKDGRMAELLIFPRQQRCDVYCYRLRLAVKTAGRINVFSFSSWEHEGIARPNCWRMGWCQEHQTVSYEVYVPDQTNTITFMTHFGNLLDIHFGDEP